MFKKKLIATLVGFSAAIGVTTSVQAFSLGGYNGPVTMVISGVDQGTLYSTSCIGSGSCDATVSSQSPGSVGSEDSWGLFRVQAIYELTGGSAGAVLWTAGSAGEYLVGTYGGLVDVAASLTYDSLLDTTQQRTVSNGGFMNLYLTNTLAGYTAAVAAGAAGRTGTSIDGVDGVGTTFLTALFSGTALRSFIGDAMTSVYTFDSAAGSANGYLDITGGDYESLFRKNTIRDQACQINDQTCQPNYVDIGFATQNLQGADLPSNWTVGYSGNVNTSVIPEPGSMALAGLGLIGLAALRRRKSK
ncbi:MAG: PEP-CTERM sorting domain-containing protein [Rhodocyclaceae bacterium]